MKRLFTVLAAVLLFCGCSRMAPVPVVHSEAARPSAPPSFTPPPAVVVPSVIGLSKSQAFALLTAAGFDPTLDSTSSIASSTDATPVIDQLPASGTPEALGAPILLTLEAPAPTPTLPAPATSTVKYSIWGNGSTAGTITYSVPSGANSIEQATEAALPWSIDLPADSASSFTFYSVSAQNEDGTSISCSIMIDGTIVEQQTATGPYSIVECDH